MGHIAGLIHRTGRTDLKRGYTNPVLAILINLTNCTVLAVMRLMKPTQRIHLGMLALLALVAFNAFGCHRQYYREQADMEAYHLIDQKAAAVARPPNVPLRIDVDRRSRMFNPFDLDFQPMPLDDPASYRYMQCVDGRRGYPLWETAGLTNGAESPDWWQFLPLNEDGVLVLNAENATKIALLESPAYQEQLEALYFLALDVSGERFQFDTQFFGGAETILGTNRGGPTELEFGDRNMRMRRNFATGGNLLVGLANEIVWNLGDSSTNATANVLDFTLLMPLLRNAGRDKVMEGLTQSERELLAGVRAFERFRRGFYVDITTGNRANVNVQTAAGNISLSPRGFTSGSGFIGLLRTQLEIRNQQENITRQREVLLLFEDSLIELLTTIPDPRAIVSQRIQVAQTRQGLTDALTGLVRQQANFQLQIDTFLRTLGLPPYICVELDDPILRQFELIDQRLLKRREELSILRANVGKLNIEILEQSEFKINEDTGLPVSQIEWTPKLAESLQNLQSELQPLENFLRDVIESDLPTVGKDIFNFEEAIPQRNHQAETLKALFTAEQESICSLLNISDIDKSIFDTSKLAGLLTELNDDHKKLEGRLTAYLVKLNNLQESFNSLQNIAPGNIDPRELARRLRDDVILASQNLVADLGDDVLVLQLIQAQARTESVFLPEVDISPEIAFEIARRNRRDYANARAALVDAWRQIEVVADDLESDLNVNIRGGIGSTDINNTGLNKTGNLDIALQWDAPITRLVERNNYRRILINYEQKKRDYYQFEDAIWTSLRAEIRQLLRDRLSFEYGRKSVGIAADQIELNADDRDLREASPRATTGAIGNEARNTIQALTALLRAQNSLLGIYVNYEAVRRTLDLDLGTMELTPEGLWIDPGKISPETLLQDPGTTLDGLIDCGCNDCGLRYNPLPREPEFSAPVYKISNDQPITLDGMPIEELPSLGQEAEELPTKAMPLQTPASADMPLPADMPAPNVNGPTLSNPSVGGATLPDAEDAKLLKQEQDTATVPAADANLDSLPNSEGSGLNSPIIPELSPPSSNQ